MGGGLSAMPTSPYLVDKVWSWAEEGGNKGSYKKNQAYAVSLGDLKKVKDGILRFRSRRDGRMEETFSPHPPKRQRGMIVGKPIVVRQAEQRIRIRGGRT